MDVGNVIKTGLDNDEQVEVIALLYNGLKKHISVGVFNCEVCEINSKSAEC